MILYVKNSKVSQKTITVNEFSKVAAYKINKHKSMALLYNNNELSETKIKKTTHNFSQKKPWNKFNQGGKDLYSANCLTLKKENKDNTNGRAYHTHGLEE